MTYLNPNAIQAQTISIDKLDSALQEKITTVSESSTLVLRAYLFDCAGSYTKSELETLLSVTLDEIVASIYAGAPLIIMSRDATTANLSFIVESNYTLDDSGNLTSLTLQWHQYGLWCNLYAVYNETSDNYQITITKT